VANAPVLTIVIFCLPSHYFLTESSSIDRVSHSGYVHQSSCPCCKAHNLADQEFQFFVGVWQGSHAW